MGLLQSRGLQLFRSLFPSWRFFDDVGHALALSARVSRVTAGAGGEPGVRASASGVSSEAAVGTSGVGSDFGPWIDLPVAGEKRGAFPLLLNARGNFLFAAQSLLQQLENDIDDEAPSEVSIELVRRLVLQELLKHEAPGFRYQFRVSTVDVSTDELRREDFLLSVVYDADYCQKVGPTF
jgi:hypothetical protein